VAVPIETWFFATAVVRAGDRFVLVHESNGTWGLPGGRLEVGESFAEAARREAREEAGIEVTLESILDLEHTPLPGATARMGVSFLARAAEGSELKTTADEESLGAAWFEQDDLASLQLRGPRIKRLVHAAFSPRPPIELDRIVDSAVG
jgi:ADP-ribose pyrophosphatase YjhB (NUDIX family)